MKLKRIRVKRIVIAVPIVSMVAYTLLRIFVSLGSGYDWNTMDWNSDGKTTLIEFFDSSEIGARRIVNNSTQCIEYYSYKDGLTVKVVCS